MHYIESLSQNYTLHPHGNSNGYNNHWQFGDISVLAQWMYGL